MTYRAACNDSLEIDTGHRVLNCNLSFICRGNAVGTAFDAVLSRYCSCWAHAKLVALGRGHVCKVESCAPPRIKNNISGAFRRCVEVIADAAVSVSSDQRDGITIRYFLACRITGQKKWMEYECKDG